MSNDACCMLGSGIAGAGALGAGLGALMSPALAVPVVGGACFGGIFSVTILPSFLGIANLAEGKKDETGASIIFIIASLFVAIVLSTIVTLIIQCPITFSAGVIIAATGIISSIAGAILGAYIGSKAGSGRCCN